MSIIRVIKDSRTRYLLTDAEPHLRSELSWEARGLHAYLMLKPDNWQVRIADLMNAGPARKDKLRRMLRELEEAGYLNRNRIRGEDGQFATVADVFERVDLNPEHTPICGGNGSDQGGKSAVDQGGFTGVGKPVDITNTDLTTYKGDFRHLHETPGPFDNGDFPTEQEIHDMTVELAAVCKGYANLLVPDSCPFRDAAITLVQAGRTHEQVQAFKAWWEQNGSYEGQPALKSLMSNLENSINGVAPGKKRQRSSELRKALSELDRWIARQLPVDQFSSEWTLIAIRGVGESSLRGMTEYTRATLLKQFETEFERAKREDGAKQQT